MKPILTDIEIAEYLAYCDGAPPIEQIDENFYKLARQMWPKTLEVLSRERKNRRDLTESLCKECEKTGCVAPPCIHPSMEESLDIDEEIKNIKKESNDIASKI